MGHHLARRNHQTRRNNGVGPGIYGTGRSPKMAIAFTHAQHNEIADMAHSRRISFAAVARELIARALADK
jgi:hypothetical protein